MLEEEEAAEEEREAEPPAPEYGPTWAGVVMAALPVAVYALSGPRAAGSRWFVAGSGVAERIAAGERWRTVTALTLHADPSHLLANVVSGALLFTALCRVVGPGVGAWLVLLAGAGGNALNAFMHGAHHDAVGASTAVLGAVGALSGLAAVRARGMQGRRGRAWVPLAAGLALLAMLGADRRTDLGAHFFGFVTGIGLGIAAAFAVPRPLGRAAQSVLALGALGAVVACWLIALG